MKERQERITEKRQQQPIEELHRKLLKARGRFSSHSWIQEHLDWAKAEGRRLFNIFNSKDSK